MIPSYFRLILRFCHLSPTIKSPIFSCLYRSKRISFSNPSCTTNNTTPGPFSIDQKKLHLSATKMADSLETLTPERNQFLQNVIVMRHGDRMDNFEPDWISKAQRPWDPPLTEAGKKRAWKTGETLRKEGIEIERVFVSPFLRCVQTTSEVVSALCAVDQEQMVEITKKRENPVIDSSKVKVSIENGLCEALNSEAIRVRIPKDGNWVLDISELEAILPSGTIDPSPELVYQKLPDWQEPMEDARDRYVKVIRTLSDKFPRENLLLVTHGEGVRTTVLTFMENKTIDKIDYCACTHLQRLVTCSSSGQRVSAEDFKVPTRNVETGITYIAEDVFPADLTTEP